MFPSNLPPGVTNAMIEDQCNSDSKFEDFVDSIWEDIDKNNLSIEEAKIIWNKSLSNYMKLGVEGWEDYFDSKVIKVPFFKYRWKPGKGPVSWLINLFTKDK